MMVSYLFPPTDESPAPLRPSVPDSRQAEKGTDVTRTLGTRAGRQMVLGLVCSKPGLAGLGHSHGL